MWCSLCEESGVGYILRCPVKYSQRELFRYFALSALPGSRPPRHGRHHAGGRRGDHPLPPPQAARGPGLHPRRLHHRTPHPAIRSDPRRRKHQDPRRGGGDLPDVQPRPGILAAQAVPGGCHGLHRRLPRDQPDALAGLPGGPDVRLVAHGFAVPRRHPGHLLDHHHRQGAQRAEDEARALRPADLWRADRRGHPRHRHHRPAVGPGGERFGGTGRGGLDPGQAESVHDRGAGDRHPAGAAPAGLRGQVRQQRDAADHGAGAVLRLLPAGGQAGIQRGAGCLPDRRHHGRVAAAA
ncbi:hypothetical protein COLO4_01829 [Corchorus olitorius]|uniref:Uncharacterized protein n=1 Tax=Corchorus olitorius TaxID=93759 RepID=A0A1R3L259_9ROSI|nr:hypothetical protein COLO4_01829 [Corchorus olitorius]